MKKSPALFIILTYLLGYLLSAFSFVCHASDGYSQLTWFSSHSHQNQLDQTNHRYACHDHCHEQKNKIMTGCSQPNIYWRGK